MISAQARSLFKGYISLFSVAYRRISSGSAAQLHSRQRRARLLEANPSLRRRKNMNACRSNTVVTSLSGDRKKLTDAPHAAAQIK
jgi:hypothetical protein